METNILSEIAGLYTALAQAQIEFEPVIKNCSNPFFKNKYADIAEIRRATTPALSKYGLSVMQIVEQPDNDFVSVKTVLCHKSGGSVSSAVRLKPTKNDCQGIGSALTYARRYSLAAILNVAADDDDDAETAVGREAKHPAKRTETRPESTKIEQPSKDTAKTETTSQDASFKEVFESKVAKLKENGYTTDTDIFLFRCEAKLEEPMTDWKEDQYKQAVEMLKAEWKTLKKDGVK